ncbi:unnamed protein product, partial [Staurois parvus]
YEDTCTQDEDCPVDAVCRRTNCYCASGLCSSKHSTHCNGRVKLDEECVAQKTASMKMDTIAAYTFLSPTLLITPLETSTSPQWPQTAQAAVICPKTGSTSPCICRPG